MDRYQAFYLGLRHIRGLSIPTERSHIITSNGLIGRLRRAWFKMFGPSKALVEALKELDRALITHIWADACNAIPLARALQIPLIVTFHGYDVTVSNDQMPPLYVRRQNQLKKAGARFLCVSEFTRRRVIGKGFPAHKTIVHYTGIDTEFFNPQPPAVRAPIVLFVGRLVAKKGCDYLIRAMARVQETAPEVRLVVLGDDHLRNQLERQATAVLKNSFLGAKEPVVVTHWMGRATVFCTPSVTAPSGDAEGFGMVFVEAQAMGLPVVSFASGGIPEAVANNETGFLVAEKDWEVGFGSTANRGRAASFLSLHQCSLCSRITSPLLVREGKVRPATVVAVEIASPTKTVPADTWGYSRRRCREVIERCMLPDKDVVLPSMHASDREVVFVLACTDLKGAAVLEARISSQLGSIPEVAKACNIRTFCVSAAGSSAGPNELMEQLEWISRKIEELALRAVGA